MAAEPATVRLVRAEVLRWLQEHDLHDERLETAIGLATSEAVSNVVRHAYESTPGRVDLEATMEPEEILIRVCDRGPGLVARSPERTGLGLPVIARVTNGVTVASDADGTTVSMRFALEPRRFSRLDRFARATHVIAG